VKPSAAGERLPGRRLGLDVTVAVLTAVIVALGLLFGALWYLSFPPLVPVGRNGVSLARVLDLLKLSFAVIAGVGGVIALVVAYRKQQVTEAAEHRQQTAESRADEAHKREATKLFNERFATAASQLGHDSPAVRLAGVHALAGLADDAPTPELRQTMIDVLCAYLRIPYAPDPGEDGDPAEHLHFAGLREVRHTIIRLITAHIRENASVSWQGHDFDFTGVVFDGGDFSDAVFSGGKVNFGSARFTDGTIIFARAQFRSSVSFDGTLFSGGFVTFARAVFADGTVTFRRARFGGGVVYFASATFSGGDVNLSSAKFSGAKVAFTQAKFAGSAVRFYSAEFTGGTVDFGPRYTSVRPYYGASFSAGVISFGNAKFTGGTINFGARFAGSTVRLDSKFSGSTVNFEGAEFVSGTVDLVNAEFTGGRVDFSRVEDWNSPPQLKAGIPTDIVFLPSAL
ncbi:pentapeptide repeat-containing protein, partial [Nonomuraea sp. RK-328]|nr:pentapeptide repeat-containing protein [Nonomuraea sp. RK-328]